MRLSPPIKGIGNNGVVISQKFGNVLILSKPYTFGGVTYPAGTNFYKAAFGMEGHNGIDIACPIGTPVYAEHDGVVTKYGNTNDGGYGIYIKLRFEEDGFGWDVVGGHLSKVLKTGQIKRGELIALSGNSGTSTNPHLHRGLAQFKNGKLLNANNGFKGSIDPAKYEGKEMNPNIVIYKNGSEYQVGIKMTSEQGFAQKLVETGCYDLIGPDGKPDFAKIDKIAHVL